MSKKLAILIHGWGNNGSSAFFPSLKKDLEEKGYIVFSPNLPNSDSQTLEISINYLETILKENKYDDLYLVGHSSGGYLACKLSEKYKVNKLILVAPTAPSTKWSEERIVAIDNWLNKEAKNVFFKYHESDIEFEKIIENCKEIEVLFGLKDPYIDETNRKFYIEKLIHKTNIQVFEQYRHMGSGELLSNLEILENLFPKN